MERSASDQTLQTQGGGVQRGGEPQKGATFEKKQIMLRKSNFTSGYRWNRGGGKKGGS